MEAELRLRFMVLLEKRFAGGEVRERRKRWWKVLYAVISEDQSSSWRARVVRFGWSV